MIEVRVVVISLLLLLFKWQKKSPTLRINLTSSFEEYSLESRAKTL